MVTLLLEGGDPETEGSSKLRSCQGRMISVVRNSIFVLLDRKNTLGLIQVTDKYGRLRLMLPL